MTRTSTDEIRDGYVFNGFDYVLQVWILEGVVQPCAHPGSMRAKGSCCNQHRYASKRVAAIPGAECLSPADVRDGVRV